MDGIWHAKIPSQGAESTVIMKHNPATIFIVDDDMAARESVRVLLQIAGYAVTTYSSCRHFIENLRQPETACLILDPHLQNMGAREPGAFLKERGVDIPVVLITRPGNPVLPSQLSGSRTLALLEKPLDYDLLLKTIDKLAHIGFQMDLKNRKTQNSAAQFQPPGSRISS